MTIDQKRKLILRQQGRLRRLKKRGKKPELYEFYENCIDILRQIKVNGILSKEEGGFACE